MTTALVAKLADARDLKSRGEESPCGFDPHRGHLTWEKRMCRMINKKTAKIRTLHCFACRRPQVMGALFSDTWTMTIAGEFYSVPVVDVPCLHCAHCGATWLTDASDAVIAECRAKFCAEKNIRPRSKFVSRLSRRLSGIFRA